MVICWLEVGFICCVSPFCSCLFQTALHPNLFAPDQWQKRDFLELEICERGASHLLLGKRKKKIPFRKSHKRKRNSPVTVSHTRNHGGAHRCLCLSLGWFAVWRCTYTPGGPPKIHELPSASDASAHTLPLPPGECGKRTQKEESNVFLFCLFFFKGII